MMPVKKHILLTIVLSQFLCTSLWFAGNAVLGGLIEDFHLSEGVLGHMTAAVQVGFITGTLLFAVFSVADRWPPSMIFLVCALGGALVNASCMGAWNTLPSLLMSRFLVGFFLAGIYPVGMKIAADYFEGGLGKSLGYLVGALVMGTAFPHLLRDVADSLPWKYVILGTSALAFFGGLLMATAVPEGPYRKAGAGFRPGHIFSFFHDQSFRRAAFGYFGHMWELYTFWAFVPVMLRSLGGVNVSLWAFIVIGVGSLACVAGGYLSQVVGVGRVAKGALLLSGICCLLSPFVFGAETAVVLGFLMFWGVVVVADSPMFSTLVAGAAPAASKGTALTIVNCIGFSLTILSIELLTFLQEVLSENYLYLILVAGPLLGLVGMFKRRANPSLEAL